MTRRIRTGVLAEQDFFEGENPLRTPAAGDSAINAEVYP